MDGSEDNAGFAPPRAGGWKMRWEGSDLLRFSIANEAGSPPRHAAGWKAVREPHTWALSATESPAASTNSSPGPVNLLEQSGPFHR